MGSKETHELEKEKCNNLEKLSDQIAWNHYQKIAEN